MSSEGTGTSGGRTQDDPGGGSPSTGPSGSTNLPIRTPRRSGRRNKGKNPHRQESGGDGTGARSGRTQRRGRSRGTHPTSPSVAGGALESIEEEEPQEEETQELEEAADPTAVEEMLLRPPGRSNATPPESAVASEEATATSGTSTANAETEATGTTESLGDTNRTAAETAGDAMTQDDNANAVTAATATDRAADEAPADTGTSSPDPVYIYQNPGGSKDGERCTIASLNFDDPDHPYVTIRFVHDGSERRTNMDHLEIFTEAYDNDPEHQPTNVSTPARDAAASASTSGVTSPSPPSCLTMASGVRLDQNDLRKVLGPSVGGMLAQYLSTSRGTDAIGAALRPQIQTIVTEVIAATGAKLMQDLIQSEATTTAVRSTTLGYIPLATTGDETIWAPTYYCPEASGTLISPDFICSKSDSFYRFGTDHNIDTNKGILRFHPSDDGATLEVPLTRRNRLWYIDYEILTTSEGEPATASAVRKRPTTPSAQLASELYGL